MNHDIYEPDDGLADLFDEILSAHRHRPTLEQLTGVVTRPELVCGAYLGFTDKQCRIISNNTRYLAELAELWADGVPQSVRRIAGQDDDRGALHREIIDLAGADPDTSDGYDLPLTAMAPADAATDTSRVPISGHQDAVVAQSGASDTVEELLIEDAMRTLELEWWLLSQPTLAAAAAAADSHLDTLVDRYDETVIVTRQEAVAGRAWVQVEVVGLSSDRDDLVIAMRSVAASTGAEPETYWFLLRHDPVTNTHRSDAELPCPTKWIELELMPHAFPARSAATTNIPVIARSVRTATLSTKTQWQELARTERGITTGNLNLVQGVIEGLTAL